MGFLKVITSIAIGLLLLIFLNNLMGLFFPTKSYSDYGNDASYKKCESLTPKYDANNPVVDNAQSDKYQKCIEEATREQNDKNALLGQYIWIRAIIVLLVLVGIAIAIFKKYPFFGGALIGGGLLFCLTYPFFAQTGFSFDFLSGGGDISDGVKRTTTIIKMLTSFFGLAGLAVADMLFFEAHKANVNINSGNFQYPVRENPNHSEQSNDSDNIYPKI